MIKNRELEHISNEFEAFKQITHKQAESFREMVNNLTKANEDLKDDNSKLAQQVIKLKDLVDEEVRMAVKDN